MLFSLKACSFSSMSCIRLPPARKAWKRITSTLGKLHKIHRSKAMKRARVRKHLNTPTKENTRAPKFLATRRSKSKHKRLANIRSVVYGFYKKPAPIYIDKLFKEPSYDLVDHNLKPQIAHTIHQQCIENTAKFPYQAAVEEEVAGTRPDDITCSSDDRWESLALASPLMHRIDERAEEFIARFRGEMAAQEKLARNL